MFKRKEKLAPIPSHVPQELVYDFDIFEPPSDGDIQKKYMKLQEDAPDIFYTPRNGGQWVSTRFAECQQIMRTPELFSSQRAFFKPDMAKVKISLPPQDMDAPDHIKHRLLAMKFLSPRMVQNMETNIRKLMTELIDNVVDKKGCEFMAAVSIPLPVKTFMSMMGMDLSRYTQFVKWANGILGSETMLQRLPHFIRMTFYLKSLIRKRKKQPSNDPVSLLLASEVDGQQLTEKRVLEICNLLFLAGLDTVTNAMTFMTKHLAENPEQQQDLRENPDKIPAAIEEMMRRYTFVNIPRRVTQDTEIAGVKMHADEIVISAFAAASNDPRSVDDPNTVDFNRPKSPHLAFNTGPHNCAGASLARMELRIFLEEWLSRVPAFKLADNYKPVARCGPVMALEELQLNW